MADISTCFPTPPGVDAGTADDEAVLPETDAPPPDTLPDVEPGTGLASSSKPQEYEEIRVFRWARTTGGAELGRNEESAGRMAKATARLRLTGPMRPLYRPPGDWAKLLDEMETNFPNFGDVLRYVVRPHAALTARGLRHRMAPLLMVGPPGI